MKKNYFIFFSIKCFFFSNQKTITSSFIEGDIAWFLNGKINVSYNCLDRHLEKRGDQIAIIWEGNFYLFIYFMLF